MLSRDGCVYLITGNIRLFLGGKLTQRQQRVILSSWILFQFAA